MWALKFLYFLFFAFNWCIFFNLFTPFFIPCFIEIRFITAIILYVIWELYSNIIILIIYYVIRKFICIDINKLGSDGVTGEVDPNIKIYANKLPDDIVDDKYNNIGMQLPNDVQDNCCYESEDYKAWYKKWCKEIQERKPIECKK